MGELFNTIERFFTNGEWIFEQLDERPVLHMSFLGRQSTWDCYAQVNEEQFIFYFYSICPVSIPPDRMAEVAEYLHRANYGLKIGNFELDYSDGEVRYKTSIDVENGELTHALISNLVEANVWTMDKYLPGIYGVVFGGLDPLAAVEKVESEE